MKKIKYDEERYEEAHFACGHFARLLKKGKRDGYKAWLQAERLCPTCYAKKMEEMNREAAEACTENETNWNLPPLIGFGRALDLARVKRSVHMAEILQIEHRIRHKLMSGEDIPRGEDMLNHIRYWKSIRNPKFWIRVQGWKWKSELKLIADGELRALCGMTFMESNTNSNLESGTREMDSESPTKSPGAPSAEITSSPSESSTTLPDRDEIRWSPAAMVRRTPRK